MTRKSREERVEAKIDLFKKIAANPSLLDELLHDWNMKVLKELIEDVESRSTDEPMEDA